MTTVTVRRRNPSRDSMVIEPLNRPMSLPDEIERFASDVQESWTPVIYRIHMHPHLDVYEQKGELLMRAELPEIRKESIDISLEDGCVSIKVEMKQKEVSKEATCYSCEHCLATCSRLVSLPFLVEADKISASFESGLQEIRLTKAEQIEVKVK